MSGSYKNFEDMTIDSITEDEIVINGQVLTKEEPTKAQGFPLYEYAQKWLEFVKPKIDRKTEEFIVDCFRGLSPYMQYTICMVIMDYHLFGKLSPTGVNHVDALVKEMVKKIPFPEAQYLNLLRKKSN